MVRSSMMEVVTNHILSHFIFSHQGVEHLHLRGLWKPLSHNASLLHRVALFLWHAFLSVWHPGCNQCTLYINTSSISSAHSFMTCSPFNCFLHAELLNAVDTIWKLSHPGIHARPTLLILHQKLSFTAGADPQQPNIFWWQRADPVFHQVRVSLLWYSKITLLEMRKLVICKCCLMFRQSSMQLSGDNSTISVKVSILSRVLQSLFPPNVRQAIFF